ncbi:annulin-like [Cimex lectularius]|uniref:Transglutaminase-like domain-containing protein n=1 Tax=Cimex lectularius TaxID=79782 RepID=A0A8I6TC90_CIMLE|nr:annulin-like [Cimex lectularius]
MKMSRLQSPVNSPYRDNVGSIPHNSNLPNLVIKKFDPRLGINLKLHDTLAYEMGKRESSPQLVTRRGQVVYLYLYLDREYSPSLDIMSAIFTYKDCEDASVGHYTLSVIPLSFKSSGLIGKWAAWIAGFKGTRIDLRFVSSFDCTIGRWGIEIDTKVKENNERSTYALDTLMYVIFNPYAPDDEVKIDDTHITEYVTNEHGLIYRGNMKPNNPTYWVYGQFAKDVLDCALYLITDVAKLPVSKRSNAVEITRALTSTINANNCDGGVMLSSTTGNFDKTESPLLWCASAPILQAYYSTKEPLRFANCLVLAGVLTTVCRALGIAARPVTCFNFVHGNDLGLVVNLTYDEDHRKSFKGHSSPIWNYHVWTEVWMKRTDIGDEYDGWQILDPTLHVPGTSVFSYGPTSVKGIRKGKYKAPYNGTFTYFGINSQIFVWKKSGGDEHLKLIAVDRTTVGSYISTKAEGSWQRADITQEYKDPKGKVPCEECYSALLDKSTDFSRFSLAEEFNEVGFTLTATTDVPFGQPFSGRLDLVNINSSKSFTISVTLTVRPILYSGREAPVIKSEIFDVKLAKNEAAFCKTIVPYEEYAETVLSEFLFKCTCQANVKETDFDYYSEAVIKLQLPKITIEVNSSFYVDKATTCMASFVNPLPIAITNGLIFLQGPLFKKIKAVTVEDCAPKKKIMVFFTVTPVKEGEFMLLAKFMSDQLSEIEGSILIKVSKQG